MDVSVVVPKYNRLSFIKKTIRSIEELNYSRSAFELIVVDDGSTDGTKEFLDEYSKKTELNFSFSWQQNKGPAAARNAGIALAKGKYIAFTDSDCIVDREWLTELLTGFETVKFAAVGGSVKGIGEDVFSKYFEYTGLYNTRVINQNVIYLLTLNACFKKDVIQSIGGFSERFRKPGGEDPELCLRICKKRYSIGYSSGAIVHHHHKSNLKSFIQTFKNYGEGQATLVKWHPEWYNRKAMVYSFLPVNAFKFFIKCRSRNLKLKETLAYTFLHYLQYVVFYMEFLSSRRMLARWLVNPIPWEKV